MRSSNRSAVGTNVTVFYIVLLAAALHTTWNAIVKRGGDTLLTTIVVARAAAFIAAVGQPFLPYPSAESWPFIAASSLFQIACFVLVAHTFAFADMSFTYPLMRGTAALLAALASLVPIGSPLSRAA